MTDIYKAAQMALEALEQRAPFSIEEVLAYDEKKTKAILSLRTALAEQQEPVAWIDPKHLEWLSKSPDNMTGAGLAARKPKNADMVPLYTAPQPKAEQEPFGYFRAEPFGWTDCAETDEGAIPLYERPQPNSAVLAAGDVIAKMIDTAATAPVEDWPTTVQIDAALAEWKSATDHLRDATKMVPLTTMDIVNIKQLIHGTLDVQFIKFARAIERAHGIGGQP